MSQDEAYLKAKGFCWVMKTRQRVHQKIWQTLFHH